jgi:hypothetical protein
MGDRRMTFKYSAFLLIATHPFSGPAGSGDDKLPAIRLVNKSLDRWATCESVTFNLEFKNSLWNGMKGLSRWKDLESPSSSGRGNTVQAELL